MKATVIEPNKEVEEKQKIRVAAYARVSTNSDEQEESYENQVKYYKAMIQSNPNYEFVGVFADQAISGTTSERPGFLEMIRQAKSHKIDMIITKSISRFSRNAADLLNYTQLLNLLGVNLRFEEENIETNSTQGPLMLALLGAIAQMEVQNISAHVNWTLQNKMKDGELVGNAASLGYDVVESKEIENGNEVVRKRLVINEQEAETVRFIFKRYLEGAGCRTIGKELESMGVRTKKGNTTWYDNAIIGILKNEKYIGTLLQGKSYTVTPIKGGLRQADVNMPHGVRRVNKNERPKYEVKQNHDAIISEDDFYRVQEIMRSRCATYKNGKTKGTTKNSSQSIFTSKIKCKYCGKNFQRRIAHHGTNSEKAIWQCSTYIKNGKDACPHCKAVDEEVIKKAFVKLVSGLMNNPEYPYFLSEESFKDLLRRVEQDNSMIEKQIQIIENDIAKNMRKRQKLIDSMLEEKITQEEFDSLMEPLRKTIEQQQDMIQSFRQECEHEKRQVASIQEIRTLTHNGDINAFNTRLFNLIVDHIDIGGLERNNEGELISNPKRIDFALIYDNLDHHNFNYYTKLIKQIEPKPLPVRSLKSIEDTIFGIPEEDKKKALEQALQKTED